MMYTQRISLLPLQWECEQRRSSGRYDRSRQTKQNKTKRKTTSMKEHQIEIVPRQQETSSKTNTMKTEMGLSPSIRTHTHMYIYTQTEGNHCRTVDHTHCPAPAPPQIARSASCQRRATHRTAILRCGGCSWS